MRLLFVLIVIFVESLQGSQDSIAVLILNQPTAWHEQNTVKLEESLREDIPEVAVLDIASDFADVHGAWAVWPVLTRVFNQLGGSESTIRWLLICEDGTTVKGKKLVQFLQQHDANEPIFMGHALRDSAATIIHHFEFIGENVSHFAYPDFAGGMVMSWPLVDRVVTRLREGKRPRDFSIDAKHELAMIIWDDGKGSELIDAPEFCTISTDDGCITEFSNGDYQRCSQPDSDPVVNDDVVFAVKTFHEFHKTRVVIVKRTWGQEAHNIEYFSDREDHYIPTITVGVNNTERGHCGKTLGILQHYVTNHADTKKWLVIADDDTILNVKRMIQLLNCYDHKESLIIGERYGYGFDNGGNYGYAYPTGGSGMIFTSDATRKLVDKCSCPTPDSPDDMILGLCSQSLNIHMIHSPALHQARPPDYSEDYLKRIKPISFHKHWEIDPYLVYSQWISDTEEKATDRSSPSHDHGSEL